MTQPNVSYEAVKAIAAPPLRHLYRIDVDGVSNIPDKEPVILAANHRSFMDSIFMAFASPRPLSFLAKAEYWDRRRTRWIVRRFGAIPVRRGSPAGARQAISAAAEVLLQGGALGIYPEGTRSRDGMLHRGHPGPVRLARATGAALVPVGLVGTSEVQRPGERVPRPFRSIGIRFGEPQRLDEDADLRRATDDLMQEIATLCGQEYVDTFATAG